MTQDPRYSPPTAAVADPLTPVAPARVRSAVRLLWISMALAVPASGFSLERGPEGADLLVGVAIYAVLFAINAWINLMVYRGRNWARIVTFIFLLIGAYYMFDPGEEPVPAGVVEWAINLVCLVLESVAVVWLFTQPGAAWFAQRR